MRYRTHDAFVLFISLASSVETRSTLSYDTEMNTIVIISESGIYKYIEQMYYSFYPTRHLSIVAWIPTPVCLHSLENHPLPDYDGLHGVV